VGTLAAMKTKPKPRARRMWANYYGDFIACHKKRAVASCHNDPGDPPSLAVVPIAVIPLHDLTTLGDSMVSALVAIGVLPRARAKKGRK
jgi:hypothetical protein